MILSLVNIQVVIFQIFIVTLVTLFHFPNFQMDFIQMGFYPGRNDIGKVGIFLLKTFVDDTGCFVLGRPYGRRGVLSLFEGGGSPKSSLGKTRLLLCNLGKRWREKMYFELEQRIK